MSFFRSQTAAPAGALVPGAALTLAAALALAACGGDSRSPEDSVERATERSRAVAAAAWSYGTDTLPPEQGEQRPRIVDRCRITLPAEGDAGVEVGGEAGGSGRTVDVSCGHLFIGLEAEADSAWIERLVERLSGEVVERGAVPGWTTPLGEPVRYLLLRVEPGREGRTIERALNSEGVRFVDVREVARRRP